MTRSPSVIPLVRYLVSARFDYSQWLCADAGPQYAESLGLAWEPFDSQRLAASDPYTVWVLDPRLQADEVRRLEELAWRFPHLWLVPRVVDPCWPPEDQNALRNLAFRLARRPRTALLLAYQPAEVTVLLADAFGPNRWFVSPYPYVSARELALGGKRLHRVLISGSANPRMYPLRALARRKRITAPRWRLLSADLVHPGYGIQAGQQQACIGNRFVAHLARYRFMLLCPSRASAELLKYGECAYAGCAPVGAAACGLPSEAAACIIPFDAADTAGSIRRIAATSEQEAWERAFHFRRVMSEARAPHGLREGLFGWLAQMQAGACQVIEDVTP